MKIRLTGTRAEIAETIEMISTFLKISSISRFYPNSRDRYSSEGRVYIEIEI